MWMETGAYLWIARCHIDWQDPTCCSAQTTNDENSRPVGGGEADIIAASVLGSLCCFLYVLLLCYVSEVPCQYVTTWLLRQQLRVGASTLIASAELRLGSDLLQDKGGRSSGPYLRGWSISSASNSTRGRLLRGEEGIPESSSFWDLDSTDHIILYYIPCCTVYCYYY